MRFGGKRPRICGVSVVTLRFVPRFEQERFARRVRPSCRLRHVRGTTKSSAMRIHRNIHHHTSRLLARCVVNDLKSWCNLSLGSFRCITDLAVRPGDDRNVTKPASHTSRTCRVEPYPSASSDANGNHQRNARVRGDWRDCIRLSEIPNSLGDHPSGDR